MNSNNVHKVGLLTRREKEVLALLTLGMTNKRIAETLSVSPNTAVNHLHSIFKKLRVKSRTEAAIYALSRGIEAISLEK